MDSKSEHSTVIIAVPGDFASELEHQGLASPLRVRRGAVADAVVTMGMDAAALVTLLQTPDSVRGFASRIRDRCSRNSQSIELNAKRGGRSVHLKVDGDIEVSAISDFLTAAFEDKSDL